MFKFKSLVVLLVFALLASFTMGAIAKDWPGDRAGKKADYLYKKLGLTLEQYTKTYQAFLDYEKKVDALALNKMDKKAKDEACVKLQTEVNANLAKIFTKDQNVKFDGMKAKFYKKVYTKKKRVVKKTETTTEPKKDVKKEEPKKDVKKEEPKKDVKKEEKKDAKK